MAKYINFKTPKGTASWPSLHKTALFKGADTGKFETKLILTKAAAKPLVDLLTESAEDEWGARKAKGAKMPFKIDADGNYVFVFRSGKDKPITVYDSAGNILKDVPKVGSGSIIRVAGSFGPFKDEPGYSAYLNSVMLLDLKTFGGGSGFGAEDAEEGGYVASAGGNEFDDEEEPKAAVVDSDDEF
jgi:hypothetical protein